MYNKNLLYILLYYSIVLNLALVGKSHDDQINKAKRQAYDSSISGPTNAKIARRPRRSLTKACNSNNASKKLSSSTINSVANNQQTKARATIEYSPDSEEDIVFPSLNGIMSNSTETENAAKEQLFSVKFSGYVKPEFFWDSRQNVGCRNDEVLVYPEPKELDRCGRDIQAHPEYNMIALESRVAAEIVGPDVLNAQAKGYLEADFWGVNEKTLNVFRLRHAFTYLNWQNMSFLFGQYWHPLYIPECFPDTLSGNAGVPMDPFKRAPQIRFTRRFEPFEFTIAALSEVNFTNDGPLGPKCTYIRNAVVPNISANLQVQQSSHIYGMTVDFKRLVPRLKSDLNVKVEESILGGALAMYAAFNWETFALRLKGIIAQNLADHSMIGGYAVHSIQPETDKRSYANLQCIAAWADFNRANSTIEPGCFIGFTKNIGASKTIVPAIKKNNNDLEHLTYGFDTETINYIFRIQPRIRWFFEPVVFGLELDYTRASFGQPNIRGDIISRPSYIHPKDHPIYPGATSNTRLLFTTIYYF